MAKANRLMIFYSLILNIDYDSSMKLRKPYLEKNKIFIKKVEFLSVQNVDKKEKIKKG